MNDAPNDPAFTHLDHQGRLRMVDVSAKVESRRYARASCRVRTPLAEDAIASRLTNDEIIRARLIGIQAAKRTSDVIPLCHPLALTHVQVDVEILADGCVVRAEVSVRGSTGVEMEALSACSFAALALMDALGEDAQTRLSDLVVDEKSGGTSGDWGRDLGSGPTSAE